MHKSFTQVQKYHIVNCPCLFWDLYFFRKGIYSYFHRLPWQQEWLIVWGYSRAASTTYMCLFSAIPACFSSPTCEKDLCFWKREKDIYCQPSQVLFMTTNQTNEVAHFYKKYTQNHHNCQNENKMVYIKLISPALCCGIKGNWQTGLEIKCYHFTL